MIESSRVFQKKTIQRLNKINHNSNEEIIRFHENLFILYNSVMILKTEQINKFSGTFVNSV